MEAPLHDVTMTQTGTESEGTTSSLNHSSHPDAFQPCRVVLTLFTFIPWNNPENIISLDTLITVVKVLEGVLVPPLTLFGMTANVLCCVVFYRHNLRDRINVLLFSLAVTDFLVEVDMLFHTVEYMYTLILGRFNPYGPFITFKINSALNILRGCVYLSGFISTAIACERCLCISKPFIAKKILKSKTAAIIVVVAGAVLVGLHFRVTEKYKIECAYYPKMGFTLKGYYPSEFYMRNSKFIDILSGAVFGITFPCLFTVITTITTIITIIKLKTAVAWRKQTSSLKQEEKSKELALTRMLVAVSCLFIICTIPNTVVRIVPLLVPDFQLGGRFQNLFFASISLSQVTNTLNSSLNFLLYFNMGSKFRTILTSLCCSLKKSVTEKSKTMSANDTTAMTI